MKILCIGEALIDMICTDVDTSLTEGQQFLKKAGGAPANVAAAIAALGGKVELAAKVGSDPFGKHLIKVMESFSVGTRWILRDNEFFTTIAFVSLMKDGERDFYFNRDADGQLGIQDIENLNLDEYSIVHFGSATAFLPGPLQEAYMELMKRCAQQNVFISFDPNYRNLLFANNQRSFMQQSWNFLKHCHFFKLSDEEALMLTETSSIQDAAEILARNTNAVFAITLGKDGTLLRVENEVQTVSSIAVKPVDTTGAGDAFVGAVLFQLSGKTLGTKQALPASEWVQVVTNANKAGARTCEYMGAMEAFKHLSSDIFK